MVSKDKIRGLFLGTAIGDSLGMPVESMSREKIKEIHGRLTTYAPAIAHKWLKDRPAGQWTDDAQLSFALAEAIIESKGINMDVIAKHQIAAFNDSTAGWGPTTREALKRLSEGVHWSESGKTEEPNPSESGKKRGLGNGISMKIAPVGAYLSTKKNLLQAINDNFPQVAKIAAMTHRTSIGVSSGLAHTMAVLHCLEADEFSEKEFKAAVVTGSLNGKAYYPETLEDDITERLNTLPVKDDEDIVEKYGKGTCYVYNSLPFTYAYFLRNPNSIESLYDVINAGGDTDSNGSMLAGLLGALHGTKIFPKHLIDGLDQKEYVIDLADRFSKTFEV